MFGHQARLPVDVAFGLSPKSEASHNSLAASLRTTLQDAFESVHTDLSWVGPYRVTKRISDATYCIQLLSNARKRIVVHFDRLEAFKGDASRFDGNSQVNLGVKQISGVACNSDQPKSPRVGDNLELCDDDDDVDRDTSEPFPGTSQSARRYPSRVHQLPTRFSDFVAI